MYIRCTALYIFTLCILCSNDVEMNPGPRYPCQICGKAVTARQRGVACDDCEKWHHCRCLNMPDCIYEALPNISWHCFNCGIPNFGSSLFDSSSKEISEMNSTTSSGSNIGSPLTTSSPKGYVRTHQRNRSNIKTLVINFQSIKNKTLDLMNVLDTTDPDIILGNETWLTSDHHSSEFFPPEFDVIRRDRPDGYGGVLIATKKDLTHEQIHIATDIEIVTIRIKLQRNQFLTVVSIYRPPTSGTEYMEKVCNAIHTLQRRFKNDVIWIGGDLNLPDISWELMSITGNQYVTEISNKFLSTIQDCGLEQQVETSTRGDKTLDLFLTNRPALTNRCTCIPGIGDHDIVFVDANTRPHRTKPAKRKIYLWKRADLEKMKEKIEETHQELMQNYPEDVEQTWSIIKNTLLTIMEDHIPSKMSSTRFNQPWINRESKRASRKKNKLFKKAKRSRCPLDWDRYNNFKKKAKTIYRTAYKDYMHKLVDPETTTGTKKFWTYVNSRKCDSTGVAPLKSRDGIMHTDAITKANMLNDQFSSVFCKNEDINTIKDKGRSPHPNMPAIKISPKEY